LLKTIMVRTAEEAVLEYREALDDLKDNNKMQINLMTILAEDYSSFSREIVNVIAQQVERVLPTQKLAVMYVMDSILKNVTGAGNYKEHIEKVVHRLFVHVFETGDEKTRLSLHKLRQTWTGIFQRSTLYRIDLAVHEIDPAWPIVTPQPSNAPTVPLSSRAPVPASAIPTSQQQQQQPVRPASRVHVNPHFFNKSTAASVADRRQLSTTVVEGKPMADPRLARLAENGRTTNQRFDNVASKGRQMQNKAASFSGTSNIKQEARERTEDVDERRFPMGSLSDETMRAHHRRREINDVGGRSPSDSSGKRRVINGVVDDAIEEKKPRVTFIRSPPHDVRSETAPPSTSVVAPRPTNDLGSHAFINAPRPRSPAVASTSPMTAVVGQIATSVAQIPAVAGHLPTSAAQMPTTVAGVASSMDQVVVGAMAPIAGASLVSSVPSTSGPYASAGGVPVPVIPIVPFAGMPPVLAPRFMPPMVVPPVAIPVTAHQPVISTESTKLEGIPANNRIFVDGRAYEVSYINDIPVIERNSLPHRIYFTGAPRNVIIDGVAHLLNFGEEKRVIIDGEEHVLKFGAPSRELYMGNYPFKGAFGGPPIFATINGVRHEIRLGGPPPEVKIEPDPCYELLRHMPRQGLNAVMNTPAVHQSSAPKEPTMDVKGLLAKLQKSGILSTLSGKKDESSAQRETNHSPTPPIPSEHRGEVTERLAKPPTDLKKFSMRALKIRYDSVVESLHQTRHMCPNCGLRFNELKGERYKHHLDWHFRENLKSNDGSRCRDWYLPVEEWLQFSEQEDLSASTSTAHAADGERNSVKECGVCGEKFEEYWDEDGDAWKLKECVLGTDGRPFHPSCILDATMPTPIAVADASEEEHASDKALLQAANRVLKKELLTGR
uniref:CID domain-containing protein n=1 Tax=Toxocara canis TaxID=6265 RepID=A0A183UVF6_TOXCA